MRRIHIMSELKTTESKTSKEQKLADDVASIIYRGDIDGKTFYLNTLCMSDLARQYGDVV